MSAIRDKVEQALKDMGLQTGDKTIKIHPMDWAALREELEALVDPSEAWRSALNGSLGVWGANVVTDQNIPLGDVLVEQKILRWY